MTSKYIPSLAIKTLWVEENMPLSKIDFIAIWLHKKIIGKQFKNLDVCISWRTINKEGNKLKMYYLYNERNQIAIYYLASK